MEVIGVHKSIAEGTPVGHNANPLSHPTLLIRGSYLLIKILVARQQAQNMIILHLLLLAVFTNISVESSQ